MMGIDPVRTIILILIDSCLWVALHFAFGYVAHIMPLSRFSPDGRLFRIRAWEKGGAVYEALFRIRAWKDRLPEGGDIYKGGFNKSRMRPGDKGFLERFVIETCRAEMSHWLVLLAGPFFFLWNPWYLGVGMAVYGVAANLPCILVQRYNRPRLRRALERRGTAGQTGAES